MCSARNSPDKRIRVLRRSEIFSILSVNGFLAPTPTDSATGEPNEIMLRACDLDVAPVLKFEEFLLDQENWDESLKRDLLIFRRLIFESRVRAGIPSLVAAPVGPDTRPRLSASAASIISFSCRSNVPFSATVGVANR